MQTAFCVAGQPTSQAWADEGDEVDIRQLQVGLPHHQQRLDKVLVALAPEFSRSYLQGLLADGAVQLNQQRVTKLALRVQAGDAITLALRPTAQSQAFRPEPVPLDVVYEDAHLLVLHKPAGLVVHPGAGNWSGTVLNGLLARDPKAATLERAGIVHRLDKNTSGLLVVARDAATQKALVEMLARREVQREYIALANGAWRGAATRSVQAAIGRDPRNRVRMAVVDSSEHPGKPARTDLTLLAGNAQYSLLLCRLHTGRTHQIRVHAAYLGHPLVGDAVYGGKPLAGFERQALHAWRLGLSHPVSGAWLTFTAALPTDLEGVLDAAGLTFVAEAADSASMAAA